MHSKIIQITTERINTEEYITEADFYENTSDFADYVAEMDEEEVEEFIKNSIPKVFNGIFKCDGRKLTFISTDEYIHEWVNEVKRQALDLTFENCKDFLRLWNIHKVAHCGHKYDSLRFSSEGGYPETFGDFILSLAHAKPGDEFYVGGIVDYHY